MKFIKVAAAALFGAVAVESSPVMEVVQLLRELEASIETDGKVEQQSYDKGACWCEDTLARKAKDISDAKTLIPELQTSVEKLSGEVATHGVEIKQLEKDIAANEKAQKDATEVRDQGHGEYESEKTESEQAIGALEAAIKVMSGAGTGFLATSMQQARLLSLAASIRPVLGGEIASRTMSQDDLKLLRGFLDHPESLMSSNRPRVKSGGQVGALQVKQNPFGDYAPQSTQITGILKGLYDSFSQSLEKANVGEAEAQKAYLELMETKKAELETLQATLEQHKLHFAEKSKLLADNKRLRDDTSTQLEADEVFFKDSKEACQGKATEWSVRANLRTEELQGIKQAIGILSSPEAQATFQNATTTLLQVRGDTKKGTDMRRGTVGKAVARQLLAIAVRHPNATADLLSIASAAAAGGHFDKVIASIDKMIEVLRAEEQDDIAHRDRCQGAQNKNTNDMEDLNHAIDSATSEISRMDDKAGELGDAISNLESEISATKADLEEALKMRNRAVKEFRQALKDDMAAVDLLNKAIVALMEFYKRNRIAIGFAQQKKQEPVYTVDQDQMAASAYSGPYQGRQDTSKPVITMIATIKEDLENEIKTSREEEATEQKSYEKERDAMRASLKAQEETKVATETELAELRAKIQDTSNHKSAKETELQEQDDLRTTLLSDCSWVASHFESRRTARKSEIDGLIEAKGFLAGMESGSGI